jgi:cytochrome c553
MFKNLVSAACGAAAMFAVVAVPASAADDVEAKVQVCTACHGQSGVPINATTPIIWGQQQSYLVKQLHDYRAGDRSNAIMSGLAKGITQEDLRPVAAYLAGKTWPAGHPADPAPAAPATVAICKACHQPNFEGGPPAPRLAGLSYEYLLSAMNAFADDTRTNNQDMPKFMKALSAQERDTIAHYLSAL